MIGKFDTVYICLCDAGELTDYLGDFGGSPIEKISLDS